MCAKNELVEAVSRMSSRFETSDIDKQISCLASVVEDEQ